MPTGIYVRTESHIQNMKKVFANISNNSDWREKQRIRRLGKKHSLESRAKMSEAQRGERGVWFGRGGEGHPRWINDRTQLAKRQERNDMAYKEWRELVKKRDGKCLIGYENCKGYLLVHHILGWTKHPEERYNVNNGITLCQAHHPRKRVEEERLVPVLQSLVNS